MYFHLNRLKSELLNDHLSFERPTPESFYFTKVDFKDFSSWHVDVKQSTAEVCFIYVGEIPLQNCTRVRLHIFINIILAYICVDGHTKNML